MKFALGSLGCGSCRSDQRFVDQQANLDAIQTVGLASRLVDLQDLRVVDVELLWCRRAPLFEAFGHGEASRSSFTRFDLTSGRLDQPLDVGGGAWYPRVWMTSRMSFLGTHGYAFSIGEQDDERIFRGVLRNGCGITQQQGSQ